MVRLPTRELRALESCRIQESDPTDCETSGSPAIGTHSSCTEVTHSAAAGQAGFLFALYLPLAESFV
jgi:hypothetical protein